MAPRQILGVWVSRAANLVGRGADVLTKSGATRKENIANVFGRDVANELMLLRVVARKACSRQRQMACSSSKKKTVWMEMEMMIMMTMMRIRRRPYLWPKDLCPSPTTRAKRARVLVFINHRSSNAARSDEPAKLSTGIICPKGQPFVYLSLMLPWPCRCERAPDEARGALLHEEQIVFQVQAGLAEALKGSNSSRVFYAQTLRHR